MSVETIAVVISTASLLLTFAAGFVWIIKRTDEQFDRQYERLSGEIGGLRGEFGALRGEYGALRRELGDRLTVVERELVEVKIAVARIEGPPRHLLSVR